MVTVKEYHTRKGDDGSEYISLELEGDVAFVQSQRTGRFYATTKRSFMYAALDESVAKSLVGSKMPGSIQRVPCDPYEYTIPETGEVITLTYTYQYVPDGVEQSELVGTSKSFA
jgi:hypothetical protein